MVAWVQFRIIVFKAGFNFGQERLPPIPEICGSNPVICISFNYYQPNWQDENEEKEAGNGARR